MKKIILLFTLTTICSLAFGQRKFELYEKMDEKLCIAEAEKFFIWNLPEDARNVLEIAAKKGSVDAMRMLGILYIEWGEDFQKISDERKKQNREKGVYWLEKAVKNGDVVAMPTLAYCNLQGWGTERNLKRAIELYKKSIELGYTPAEEFLLNTYIYQIGLDGSLPNDAIHLIEKASNEGNLDAKNFLGNMYKLGKDVQKDETRAVKIYKELVEQNYSFGYTNLAICYLYGEGVKKDYSKAEALLKECVTKFDNFSEAWRILGTYYADDKFKAANDENAKLCFIMAARMGNEEAKEILKQRWNISF